MHSATQQSYHSIVKQSSNVAERICFNLYPLKVLVFMATHQTEWSLRGRRNKKKKREQNKTYRTLGSSSPPSLHPFLGRWWLLNRAVFFCPDDPVLPQPTRHHPPQQSSWYWRCCFRGMKLRARTITRFLVVFNCSSTAALSIPGKCYYHRPRPMLSIFPVIRTTNQPGSIS